MDINLPKPHRPELTATHLLRSMSDLRPMPDLKIKGQNMQKLSLLIITKQHKWTT